MTWHQMVGGQRAYLKAWVHRDIQELELNY